VTIPVSDALAGLLEVVHDPDTLFLFIDAVPATCSPSSALATSWAAIRKDAGFDRRLQIRGLQHSCVVQIARAGSDVPEIASITGHSPFSANQILAKYLPRDNKLAWQARGHAG
jgi:integrase